MLAMLHFEEPPSVEIETDAEAFLDFLDLTGFSLL